jgi:hypothetical protein
MTLLTRTLPNGKQSHQYVYIPSRVTDNRILLSYDPGYLDRLNLVGSPELVRRGWRAIGAVIAGASSPSSV